MAVEGIKGSNELSFFKLSTNGLSGNEEKNVSFSEILNDAINNTSNLLVESDKATQDLAAGKSDNIHQVMIAAEKADISLQFIMQVRNKVLEAYNEIMRIQI